MTDTIRTLLQIIIGDFFISFGLFTFLYYLIAWAIKKPVVTKIDAAACSLISLVGIVFMALWIVELILHFTEGDPTERSHFINRILGRYGFGIWLQPLLWFSITQLLRFPKIQRNVLLRLLFSCMLIVSIEQFVIITTAMERDYLPGTWFMYSSQAIYPSNILLAIILKIIVFLIFVGFYHYVTRMILKKRMHSIPS